MKALLIDLTLTQAVIAGDVGGGDANSIASLNYLPGGMIRGALIGRYLGQHTQASAHDDTFRRLFLDGARFLHAYPLRNGERGLPAPTSLRQSKQEGAESFCFDVAIAKPKNRDKLSDPKSSNHEDADEDLDDLGRAELGDFCWTTVSALELRRDEESDFDAGQEDRRKTEIESMTPGRQVNVHIQRPSEAQPSTIFRYEAIAAGETFRAVVLAEDEATLGELEKLASESRWIKLGKSRGGAYGGVEIRARTVPQWEEYVASQSVLAPPGRIVVTLLSDALVTDPKTGLCTADGATIFGTAPLATFAQTRVVGAFNRTWGLPTDQAQVVCAGSVFAFAHSEVLLARLHEIARNGLGERCVEGLGRIAINWQSQPRWTPYQADQVKPAPIQLKKDTPDFKLAQDMAGRMWRKRLDLALTQAINRLTIEYPPKNSQLSRLRVWARAAWRDSDAGLLATELGKLKKPAADQLSGARVGGRSLKVWIQELTRDTPTVWKALDIKPEDRVAVCGAAVSDDLALELALEYAMRLVDGVLRHASKSLTEKEVN